MSKPFTTITALLLLAIAAGHAYRLYSHAITLTFAGHQIPLWASWPLGALALLLGIMLFVESRR